MKKIIATPPDREFIKKIGELKHLEPCEHGIADNILCSQCYEDAEIEDIELMENESDT